YEPAEHCGECHVQDYQDWKRSTHSRTLQLGSVREAMERQPNLLDEDIGHVARAPLRLRARDRAPLPRPGEPEPADAPHLQLAHPLAARGARARLPLA